MKLHLESKLRSTSLIDLLSPTSKQRQTMSDLDMGRLVEWILCLNLVTFDLDKGHTIEITFPPVPFSVDEKRTICFSSFPDSNTADHSGDKVFNFRIRNGPFSEAVYQKTDVEFADFKSAKLTGLPVETDGYTYASVFFRQRPDPESSRGYFQKALVLLTPHPWTGLFNYIIAHLGPRFMDSLVENRVLDSDSSDGIQYLKTSAMLESACFQISAWPSPPFSWTSEQHFESIGLPIVMFDSESIFAFPPTNSFPQLNALRSRNQTAEDFAASQTFLCNPANLYQTFYRSLESLWTCWELMVIGEPIYVMADTPTMSSNVVQALIELIKPIPYGGDFRPYFTIQDVDFSTFINRSRGPPHSVVLGVTNRVFSQVLDHWPNFITANRGKVINGNAPDNCDEPLATVQECHFKTHKSYFSKDRKLLKAILNVGINVKGVDAINNLLRQHFIELTQRLLQPLNRYFDSLVESNLQSMTLSSLRPSPDIKPFKQDAFMIYLDRTVSTLSLPSKRPLCEFYGAFLQSANFGSWLREKTTAVYRQWRRHYLLLLATSELLIWFETASSDERKDLKMRLREEIARYSGFFIVQGGRVTLGYQLAAPAEKIPQEAILSVKMKSSPTISVPDSTYSNSGSFEDTGETGTIDMSSLVDVRVKRHIKAKTAPLPSSSPEQSWLKFSTTHSRTTSESNLEKVVPKSSTKALKGIGEFIPSVNLYKTLLEQLTQLLALLAADVI